MPEATSLAELMRSGMQRQQPVAFRQGVALHFSALDARARCWRSAFAAAPGRRYVVHSADAFEFAAMLFGAWHAGKCVLVPSDLQAAAVAKLGVPVDGVAGGDAGLMPAAPSDSPWQLLDDETPLLEMFTSGSTGDPLCIPKNLRQLDQEISALARTVEFGAARALVLATVSHQHMYGMMFRVLLPLATDRSFEALRLVQVHDLAHHTLPDGCVLISSPAQLARLPDVGTSGCHIHALLSAGGPLDETAARACRDLLDVVPIEIYGSSETGAVAWRWRAGDAAAAWQPLPGVELREQDGGLQIRTRQLPTDEWFVSADRVVMAAQGFELAGRSDRIVKLEEKRMSLDALERVLLSSGLLQQVRALVLESTRPVLAVIAMPNEAGWQLASGGKQQLVTALTEALRASAGIEVLPRSWRFVDPWPATVDGKSPESLLRSRFDRRVPEFRVLEREAGRCIAELWVSPTTPFFTGHFPGQPVLPGVAQLDWLVWLSQELLGSQGGFAGLDAAKFRRIIAPGNQLRVSLAMDARGGTRYEIASAAGICATGRIRWSGA